MVLRSSVPDTATVRSTSGADSSYAGAVLPLGGPGARSVVPGNDAAVVLTGGAVAGGAAVVAYGDDGSEVDSARIAQARATALWEVPRRRTRGGHCGGRACSADSWWTGTTASPRCRSARCRWRARMPVVEPALR